MPLYTYKCMGCKNVWDDFGSMNETTSHQCPSCESWSSKKVPSWQGQEKINRIKKPGDEVKAFIEDSKEIIEEYKEELKKGRD